MGGELVEVDLDWIVGRVEGVWVMDEVGDLEIEEERVVGIVEVECIEVGVLGN